MRPPRTPLSNIGAYVPVNVVFPGVKADAKTLVQLLSTMNRNETIIECCRANVAVSGHGDVVPESQRERMVRELLPKGAAGRIDAFIREKRLRGTTTVFFRGQLLELIRWAARYADRTGTDPEFSGNPLNREKFAKAALICSDLWGERVYADRLKSTGDPAQDRLRALGPFRKGVEESAQAVNLAQTFGRGWLLFMDFMPRHFPQFLELFEKATSLTVRQYLLLTAALTVYTAASGDNPAIISETRMAAATAYKDLAQRYLELESQDADNLAETLWNASFEGNGYRSLRERPLVRGLDDRMVIADPIFLSEQISVGPLFHVVSAVGPKKGNEVFGAFGKAFEDYAGGMLDRMYPTRPGLVARLTRNVKIGDLEIDALMNDVKYVVLFEIKAAWLKEDAILGETPDRLVERLRTLYGVSTDRGERPKGVAQLARLINTILANRSSTKRFVDAGGYEKPEYWKHEFVKNGRRLSREEAMALFRDATGRTAPATWELGSYPAGREQYPVTGVSWYEAAAYAEFAGKSLPTIYHWDWVASYAPLTFNVIPLGNYASEGPVAVASTRALHRFGTYDLAGNVKEWCANEAEAGKRYILGGGWDEPPYMFPAADARSPFERSSNFGFRCVRYLESDQSRSKLAGFIAGPTRDYARERPVRDDVFDAYKRLYSYDRTPVTAVAQSADDTSGDWRRESATFPAPYGDERITVHLWLPKRSRPPFQAVILFPGSSAWDLRSVLQELSNPRFEFLVKSGRALVVPIYKGSYERGTDQFRSDYPKETSVWRDHVIAWHKDFARTIDYLETRPDIAIDKIGLFGVSLGGAMAPILLALEPRVKAAVLVVPGLYLQRPSPEVDVINFVPRVKQPVLVLNGRYDYTFPEAASQVPFFRLLGTAEEHKRRVTYASGHNPPTNDVYKETLDWFDKYLGPVK